jgi:FkbM family methyltransferase
LNDPRERSLPVVDPVSRAIATHVQAAVDGSAFVAQKLAPAFAGATLHNRAQRVAEQPETVACETTQWGYLMSLARTSRPALDLEAAQITLHVIEGTIGVGFVDRPGRQFVDACDVIGPGGPSVVTFFISGLEHIGPLVIRNAGQGPTVFEWLGVDSFQLKSESELIKVSAPAIDMVPTEGWHRYYGGFAATPAEAVRQLLFERLREPLVMPWYYGLQVAITPGEETSRALFASGAYEPASMIALQRFLKPGDVLFDVGANIGAYSLVASRLVGPAGHVYSFEPSARERAALQNNLLLSACTNVTVSPAAVSDHSEMVTLRIAAGQHRGQNTLASEFAYPGVGLERTEIVAATSLDEFVQLPQVRRPTILKVDAEGSELSVLNGAVSLLRNAPPIIMFEINDTLLHASGASRTAVEDALTRFDYTLHRLDDATAALIPIATLAGMESENFVALPPRVDPANV